ncbi:MAG: PAS domain-containing sensor histidine kinase [Pararhodobacter sp.]|nr:PAS domain-containing sensor histidine kinase [Pararhodobacter sp.]
MTAGTTAGTDTDSLAGPQIPPRRSPFRRRLQTFGTIILVGLAPLLVLATVAVLGPVTVTPNLPSLRLVLLADLIYVLVVAALVMARIAQLIAARRSRSAGSRLHLRLSALFAIIALVPTVTVAVFAVLTINIGLEGWFSDRVRNVVGNSLAAAEAYQAEQETNLIEDGRNTARIIEDRLREAPFISEGELRQVLTQAQAAVQRGLRVAFIIDADGTLRLRGESSFLFDFIEPEPADLRRAASGELVLVRDWEKNEFRAIIPLEGRADRLLYIAREVDGEILSLLDETQVTIQLYNQLERERGRVLFNFGLIYIGFALILILAAIWLGMWFAERLSRPVGRLAGAAEAVGAGDLGVQVPEEKGDDEIATMGRVFNQMTRQLKAQRDALLANTSQIEERRRLFDSVLGSVTAGVIGLDADGRVDFVNRAAETLIQLPADVQGKPLAEAVPEFGTLLERLQDGEGRLGGRVQDELRLSRAGRLETLLVRLAERRSAAGLVEGYVVAFDDVSELVSAQRMAAWGDVARRIAHEIKNPLTPIQLSADRIRRKFSRHLEQEQASALTELTEVIVRQTNDLRRIVDEFSRFARMPEPDRRPTDLVRLVRDAVMLQEAAMERTVISTSLPQAEVVLDIDATMIGQALTNLMKNAGEAIAAKEEKIDNHARWSPRMEIAMQQDDEVVTLSIADNGIGLPDDPARLFEPYVTTRAEGTGLGLPIVKKIIEEHGGTLALMPAPGFEGEEPAHAGAMAVVRLPLLHTGRGGRRRNPRNEAGQTAVTGTTSEAET